MPSPLSVGDIKVALTQRLFPAITTWNRLEARPRSRTSIARCGPRSAMRFGC